MIVQSGKIGALAQVPAQAGARLIRKPHPQSLERKQQVRKQDRRIEPKVIDRAHGDFGRERRLLAQGHELVPGTQRLVMAVVAARLAHEPDRRAQVVAPRKRCEQPRLTHA